VFKGILIDNLFLCDFELLGVAGDILLVFEDSPLLYFEFDGTVLILHVSRTYLSLDYGLFNAFI
jgi:hypothetical protein